MKKWTSEEIALIKELYPTQGPEALTDLISRNKRAITIKANRLGLFVNPTVTSWYKEIPLETKAYLAGHFDGEGCIRFRLKGKIMSPNLNVAICHRDTLELYKKHFNGSIDAKINKNGNKPMYRWISFNFSSIFNFCMSTLPFSIEKKEQLQLALDHINDWLECGSITHPDERLRTSSFIRANRCSLLKRL